MGYFAEMDIERQSERKHVPAAGYSFRCCMKELCELMGFDPDLSPEKLWKMKADYNCTASDLWDTEITDHPMRALAYTAGTILEEMKPSETSAYSAKRASSETGGKCLQLQMDFAA